MYNKQQEGQNVTQRSAMEIDDESTQLNTNNIHEDLSPQEELDQTKEKIKRILKWIKIKLEALFWVSVSAYLIWYSNFFKILFSHSQINDLFFSIFMMTIGVNVTIGVYAAFIMPFILRVNTPIDVYAPRFIYIGAISGFVCFISLIIAIWPAFGFYSPLLIFAFFLGFLNVSHFLPNNHFGSLMLGLIFFGSFFSHIYIEHDGFLHYQQQSPKISIPYPSD